MLIKAGVPQGSLLGPLLFLVYANDLVQEITSKVKLFAHDSILGETETTATACQMRLQLNIERIHLWSKKWKVTLSAEKTKCLTISRNRVCFAPLMLDGKLVEKVSFHCRLGLRLLNDGKWKRQIGYMSSLAKSRLAILKAYSKKIQRRPLLKLYLNCF